MLPLALLFLVPLAIARAPPAEVLFVGQIYEKSLPTGATVSDASGEDLPQWITVSDGTLYGVPTKDDLGRHFVKIVDGKRESVIEFKIIEEDNPCGDLQTNWVDAVFDGSGVKTKVNKAKMVQRVAHIGVENIRVYDSQYAFESRIMENVGEELNKEEAGDFHVVVKCSCGEDDLDDAMDVLDKMLDSEEGMDNKAEMLTKGHIKPRKQRSEGNDVLSGMDFNTGAPEGEDMELRTSTVHSTTKRSVTTTSAQRTTRRVDNAPVKLNFLPTMQCVRGVYCEMAIPLKTFVDAEDGDTSKLRLEVKNIGVEKEGWVQVDKLRLRSVPLKEGEFEMRLEARDKSNQMASAPFRVHVSASPPTAHYFSFEMETPTKDKFDKYPNLLADFVERLASTLKAPIESVSIQSVEQSKERGRAIVNWSNQTLPVKVCPTNEIETLKNTMVTKKLHKLKVDFMKSLGSQFQVRKVSVNLTGACQDPSPTLPSTVPSVESKESGFGWIALAAALALLLLLIAVTLCCCMVKKTKKEKPSEFVTKGMPVVFPEEVGDDCETALASTPMLVKEERPPLKMSHHENPLYKPPPPITLIAPRGTTPGLAGTPSQQRMPPPYVPP